jgi:uncharacterized secreted protein with C-terminal beta-propeller domain
MKRSVILLGLLVMCLLVVAAAQLRLSVRLDGAKIETSSDPSKPNRTMRPFSSEQELKEHLAKLAEKQRREQPSQMDALSSNSGAASPAAKTEGQGGKDESITNTQQAGVDEGGIVKLHGDHLVILRRGRLFTVKVGDNSLRPVSAINAYAPGIDPRNDWYDEMLVSDNTVVVIG